VSVKNKMFLTAILAVIIPCNMQLATANEMPSCEINSVAIPYLDIESIQRNCSVKINSINFGDGVLLEVPEAGTVLDYEALATDGSEKQFSIWQNIDGSIGLSNEGTELGAPISNSDAHKYTLGTIINDTLENTDGGCAYQNYVTHTYKFSTGYSWWYNSLNESSPRALERVQDAVDQWRFPVNRCTMATFVTNFKATYMGLTTTASNQVSSDAKCYGNSDNKNVISWGVLPHGTLGATCTRRDLSGFSILETDIKLNTRLANSFYDYASTYSCGIGDYLLVTTVAHEVGHAIGLAHAPDGTHQLMSPYGTECTYDFVGLGPGDYLGLMRHYGVSTLYEAV